MLSPSMRRRICKKITAYSGEYIMLAKPKFLSIGAGGDGGA